MLHGHRGLDSQVFSSTARGWVYGFCTALFAMGMPVQAVQPKAEWMIVHPATAPYHNVKIQWLFAEFLKRDAGQYVPVYETTAEKADTLLQWTLQQSPQQKSIVVLSDRVALVGEVMKESPRHLGYYAPLIVLLETRWCMFGLKDFGAQSAEQVLQRAQKNNRKPIVGLPGFSGAQRLWIRGMQMRTDVEWAVRDYGSAGSVVQALNDGVDVALGRCDELNNNAQADNIQLIAKGRKSEDGVMPDVPVFTDLGWMPMGNGWTALVAPKSISEADRAVMAHRLYKIAREPEVEAMLRKTGQVVVNMTPQASTDFLDNYLRTWSVIGQLLSLQMHITDPIATKILLFEPRK